MMMMMLNPRTIPFFRRPLPALTILAALLAAAPACYGQSAPQPQTAPQVAPGPPITAQTAAGDPPARVGRLAQMNGTVSFHTADADQWSPASLNYPVTSGNALWTEPGARAMLQIGSGSRLVMDGGTELDIATLDDSTLAASVPQGSVYLQVDSLVAGERYTIRTPRGDLDVTARGRYVVAAGDDDHPTTATVLEGAAKIGDHAVPAGQTASLSGPLDSADPAQITLAAARPDAFTQSVLAAEDRPAPTPSTAAAPPPAAALPQQVSGMTGAQDLAAVGTWSTAPDYGNVWYPPVSAGWVPYRDGHWAWVAPWGWTWVADEPWGFAPFHYGRWVVIHDRWAWSPGLHVDVRYGRPRPVYAPALVVFFGGGASIGVLTSDVGWVPLGWHEAYYPPYRVSRTYIRNVNITHVTNITRVTNVSTVNRATINRYHNVAGATVVNRTVMRDARPVQHSVTQVSRQQYANLHPNRQPAIRPAAVQAIHATAPGPRIQPRSQSQAEVRRPSAQIAPQSRSQPQAHLPQQKPPQGHDHMSRPRQSAAQPAVQADITRQQDSRRQQDARMQQHEAARREDEQRVARESDQRRQQDIRLRQQRDTMQHQEQQRRAQQQATQQQDSQRRDSQHRSRQSDNKERAPDPPE
ncbi:DUF6600 domain-containing protein [Ferrovibrio xuzhouensis]|uniref:DUF6600 domain-containing protein n=1 Tax=Ferrovibrio xuzhouensis TaxID=1576914 RepID=A0ABV7VJ57_9PROT